MTSWYDQARATIAAVHAGLPKTATLDERKAAIDSAYPFGDRAHWPYKAWLKARREYLAGWGYKPRPDSPDPLPLLSPLDRQKAEYEARHGKR